MSSDPSAPKANINDTINALYPRLLGIARNVTRGTSLDPHDLLQHVLLTYIEHVERHGLSDNPSAYLTTMMGNHRNRLLRARQRERLDSIEYDGEKPSKTATALEDEQRRAQERLEQAREAVGALDDLRAILDKIRWSPESNRAKVDFWAVFLLSLRIVPTDRWIGMSGAFMPDTIEELVAPLERFMPWHDDEQNLRLSVGFDVLTTIWRVCKAHAQEVASMSFGAIVEAINAHHDGEVLSSDQWTKWRSRARVAIKQRCVEEGVDYEARLAGIFNP